MYVTSFRSTQLNVKLSDAVSLFLKRNFLSVFLPAGGVSSLAYLPKNIRILGYKSSKIHQASAIYGFVGFLTVQYPIGDHSSTDRPVEYPEGLSVGRYHP
jgi:phosphatidylglycerol lysyltransferase